MLHTILGAIPDEFSWLLNIAGLKGSIDLGINELNIVLNDIEGGKVTPSKEYLPPQVVENYISSATHDKSNNTGANNVVNREKRTRSQSAVWKKERELARNTLLKIEQDENENGSRIHQKRQLGAPPRCIHTRWLTRLYSPASRGRS